MAKITRHRCRHLPVICGEQLVGVVPSAISEGNQ
jgi:hypothetical protein